MSLEIIGAVERRDQGLALADALLESSQPLVPLPEAAHARVKRRLKASLRRKATRRLRGLRPALIAGLMLLCGAAFGIALDHLVLRRPTPRPADSGPVKSASGAHGGKAKGTPRDGGQGEAGGRGAYPRGSAIGGREIPPVAKPAAAP